MARHGEQEGTAEGDERRKSAEEDERTVSPLVWQGSARAGAIVAGLIETRKTQAGWSPRVKLGPEVNVNGTEIGALFSPSGRSLLFSRDTKGADSGEFFVWHETGAEAWPPECPASGS